MAEFRFNAQRSRARRQRLLLVTVFIVVLFVLDVLSGGALRGVVRTASTGLWRASASIRASIADTGYFRTHRSLATENASLKEELASYQESTAALSAAQAENDQLRALVHLAAEQQGMTAPIVSSLAASPYGTFLVGAGTSDGIALHSLVLTPDGFVVGTVSELHPHTALVTATLAGGAESNVVIGSTPATLEGRGGGNGRAELPRDIAIATGTPVIAPSLGSRPVGVVGHVESSEANASQTVYVSLPLDLNALRYVYLIPSRI